MGSAGKRHNLYQLEHTDEIELDETDKQILQELQNNGRKTIADIARSLDVSREVVQYRMEKLEENNVILSYQANLNPEKLGHPLYVHGHIQTMTTNEDEQDTFLTYLHNHPKITYVAEMSGDWDVAITMCGENFKAIEDLVKTIRTQHADIIKTFERATIIKEHKNHMTGLLKG